MKKQSSKQTTAERLYFVGIMPPANIQQEVTAFKHQALERFKAGHALASPPHITLLPPFKSNRTDFSTLGEFVRDHKPVELRLKGFDRFDQRVIFVDVRPNDALAALQKDLQLYAHYHLGIEPEYRPFHAHMTVAFKDLKRPIFPEAFAYFSAQAYDRTFVASEITLFAYDGKTWDVQESWKLGK
jgi:2'-5' RNA ligase